MIRVIPGLAVTSITRVEDGEHAVEQATFLAQNGGERARVTITTTDELAFGRYVEGKAYSLTIDDGTDFARAIGLDGEEGRYAASRCRPDAVHPPRETVAKDIADHANAALFDHVDAIERDEIVTKIRNLVRGRLNKGRRRPPPCPVDGCKGRLEINPHETEGATYATCSVCRSTRETTPPLRPREVALLRHVATFPGGAEADRPRGWETALEALTARGLVVSYAAGGLRATGDGLAELSRHPAAGTP